MEVKTGRCGETVKKKNTEGEEEAKLKGKY